MPLSPGTHLGRYEIVSPLGAGGMGEVYRARDTRLGRSVAIKILLGGLARDEDLRARFRREAEAIAALKHPHICVLYDVGESDGADFLVMEHLEGETLAQRLQRGPLPLEKTIEHGIEIASALAAAHRHGFVHRDLKPGNVMLTPTGAKVLDFGLAKPMAREQSIMNTADATAMMPLTVEGTIAGTLGYMAPEQLEGKPADARSDLFAMGAILFEMATGKRAFDATSQAGLIAAVLGSTPAASALESVQAPALLRKIVLKCLAKDPEQRWQGAADLIDALRWVGDASTREAAAGLSPAPAGESARQRSSYRLAAVAAGALAMIFAGLLAWQALRTRTVPTPSVSGPLRLSIVAPPETTFTPGDGTGRAQYALSPDGSRIVFAANRRGERPQLWVRSLSTGGAVRLAGTEEATAPFWSPDGQSLAFFAQNKLRKVSVDGATVQDIADVPFDASSGTWSRDGVILFSASMGSHLERVRADGGPVESATTLDASRFERAHRFPQFLPDGRRFLFHVWSDRYEWQGVYLGTLDSKEITLLVASDVTAAYSEPGYLLFDEKGQLAAQRFDLDAGTLTGAPLRLPDKIMKLAPTGLLSLSVAANGTLAYWQGRRASTELVWLDRSGRELGRLEQNCHGMGFALSPDGRQIAFTRFALPENDIWRLDLESGQTTRVSFSRSAAFPVWSPDGQSVAYGQAPEGLVRQATNGAAAVEVVSGTKLGEGAEDWSRDGRWLLYNITGSKGLDIGAIDLESGERRMVVDAPTNQVYARLSPNGRWLAYASDENGSFEIFVQSFPDGPGRWQVSSGGGAQPIWSSDGNEIFYLDSRDRMIAVPIAQSASFAWGKPQPLFSTNTPPNFAPYRGTYAAAADGQRFLIERVLPNADPSTITIVLDWPAALRGSTEAQPQ